jgi:hypothetical protein
MAAAGYKPWPMTDRIYGTNPQTCCASFQIDNMNIVGAFIAERPQEKFSIIFYMGA